MFRSGTVAFIIRMAKDIPSGYEPKYLTINVMNPIPIPNTIPPLTDIGEVA